MIENILTTIEFSSIGLAVAESAVLFPWLEVAHVISISVVLGSILIVDLRLLGLAARDYPVSGLSRSMLPLTWAGFALAAITGALMFTSQASSYAGNWYFQMKMLLLVLAGLNMAIFHFLTSRNMPIWDRAPTMPLAARLAGASSVTIWILVVLAGRWVGFTMTPF